mmetsp:Transcript_8047/g.12974  ORF Transcript_8047/g.12974 Transcript_8047/m.12974 type:complete len:123 (-) Transcript_8047:233-601(-)|eukprot:CAMPEP_0203749572 /NCGR_PEP_ID=MMETSP0098-20131031/4083_1 /ASSEMBLY_ACC=CAM_ASM_000208 /TAXON_ID=96639 /ORGANISM=" , Strain NY0313808BC1" /LENGTH=122 /DNA_ID=CAMNT_0050638647 /DNA_START=320 /DNA_END=688 /DNA_ORIENTATION=-
MIERVPVNQEAMTTRDPRVMKKLGRTEYGGPKALKRMGSSSLDVKAKQLADEQYFNEMAEAHEKRVAQIVNQPPTAEQLRVPAQGVSPKSLQFLGENYLAGKKAHKVLGSGSLDMHARFSSR